MQYRMQVSPLDCTGCGNCVQVCPAKEQGAGHEAAGHLRLEQEKNWELRDDRSPRFRASRMQATVKDSQFLQASVRVLRRVRRLRRDPVRQAGHPAVRRPHDRCQRDGLLLHLRRLRSHLPLHHQQRGPRSRLGQQPLRGQRRVRLRHEPGLQAAPRQAGRYRAQSSSQWTTAGDEIKAAGQNWLDNMDEGEASKAAAQGAACSTAAMEGIVAGAAPARPARWPARSSTTPTC